MSIILKNSYFLKKIKIEGSGITEERNTGYKFKQLVRSSPFQKVRLEKGFKRGKKLATL